MERRIFLRNIGLSLAGTLALPKAFGVSEFNNDKSEKGTTMQSINKFMMLTINVSNMPDSKSFYSDKLGLKIATDYRIDDNNWWVSFAFPGGGATLTLARVSSYPDNVKPKTLSLYFETSDIDAAHKQIVDSGVKANDVLDDLFGPGSGVKFFNFEDPDGNLVHIVQKHDARAPF